MNMVEVVRVWVGGVVQMGRCWASCRRLGRSGMGIGGKGGGVGWSGEQYQPQRCCVGAPGTALA